MKNAVQCLFAGLILCALTPRAGAAAKGVWLEAEGIQTVGGWVDELRFTGGVLPKSAFMRRMPMETVLILR